MIYNYEFEGKQCSNEKNIVYLISNINKEKYYIGQTRRELKKRWANYRIRLVKNQL